MAISTLLCADGLRRGETWAWRIGLSNALAILSLPIVLVVTMQRQYFRAVPFLVAPILISIVGMSMIWPLLWARKDDQGR